MSNYRILAVGGERALLIGMARAFQAASCTFAAAAKPDRLVPSAVKYQPHLILVFGRPSPEDVPKRVAALRAEPRLAKTPIYLVASLPPKDLSGITLVLPDPSDVGEFAHKVLQSLKEAAAPKEIEIEVEVGDLDEAEEIQEIEEIKAYGARLLLVDDDPALVKLFSTAMRRSGFEVATAGDGQEGLQVTLESRPDLIIADLNMPRLDGWGLLRALRADHRVGETPLMFLSCHDDYRESLKALSAGAQDYLAKGGRLEELVGRIRKLLAPRDAFLGALSSRERISVKLQEVGVQWALRKIALSGQTGTIEVRDDFWKVSASVSKGELVSVRATIGQHQLEGTAALTPLVVLRAGELQFDPTAPAASRNLQGEVGALLEEAALKNNQAEAQALDRLMTQATKVEVDENLYPLYAQLGPTQSRAIAAMVKEGLTPRDIIARSEQSPTEIEETLRDLVRRRVLRLSS